MPSSPRDDNRNAGLIAKSDADNTPVVIEADPATKRLKVSAVITSGGSAGTQYADGDARGTATGTLGMVDDGVNIQSMAGDISGNAKVVGTGSAGTAASGVLTVQGIASMTKLLVTPDANSAVNVAQINGVTTLMGNGGTGTGSQRVTIASDNTAFSVNVASEIPGTGATNLGKAEDAAHTTGDTGVMLLGVANAGATTAFSGTDGDYTPIGVDTDGSVHVVQKAQTATLSNVASSATNVTVLAANNARKGAQFYNDSTQICYLKFGTTASSTSFTVPLAAATYYELPAGYVGKLDGIWVSANGNMRVTEIT